MRNKLNFKYILTTIIISLLCFSFGIIAGTTSNKTNYTLGNISKCITENIIIKEGLKIIYRGKVTDLKPTLINRMVVEIAICDDTENTICIFIK